MRRNTTQETPKAVDGPLSVAETKYLVDHPLESWESHLGAVAVKERMQPRPGVGSIEDIMGHNRAKAYIESQERIEEAKRRFADWRPRY